jgi:ribosomal protein L19
VTPNNNINKLTISFLNKTKKKSDENKINNIKEVKRNNLSKNKNLIINKNIENYKKNIPKIYKGPIDLRCIFLKPINEVIEHIEKSLIQKKFFYSKINQYKYYCSKNGDIFEVEINLIENNKEEQQIYYICVLSKQGNIRTNNKFIDIIFPIQNKN